MKICPLGVELFHADRWTAMSTVTVAFRNFANEPKNGQKRGFPLFIFNQTKIL